MRILVVDDERNIRNTFRLAIESFGHEVEAAGSAADAVQLLKKAGGFDVAFLDLKLSQESGLDVLSALLELSPRLTVVMVTAYASIETAVEAMRRGAASPTSTSSHHSLSASGCGQARVRRLAG